MHAILSGHLQQKSYAARIQQSQLLQMDLVGLHETVQGWLSDHLHAHAAAQPARLAPLAEVWEKLGQQAREVETYNLDRRPLVMTLFHDLSSAVSRSRAA